MTKNYWPLGIFGLSLFVVCMIIWTVQTALTNPVELQGHCGFSSQYIDENANELAQMQAKLTQNYRVDFHGPKEQSAQEFRQILLKITDNAGKITTNAGVEFYLTRPHTNAQNQTLGAAELVDNAYQSPTFLLADKGRYQAQALVSIGDTKACFMQEYLVR